ncbi:MAG TPA: DUF305 domain-containing protein [Gemmatimonadales bacterium]|nr:DUF305 domain-containing protein [Gemmatimonadales bacterium]
MKTPFPSACAAALLVAAFGCAGATHGSQPPAAEPRAIGSTGSAAQADSSRMHFTDADVYFMTGMISHHAQAVLIAGWAGSHGASPSVHTLCDRIVVAQHDEIVMMQRWLRDRHLPVPDGDASHDNMPGMPHSMMMPGMLSPAQLAQLDSARGSDFDRLFLTFMIQHHRGAVTMVNQLFGSPGGGEEEVVFKFASDVYADQTTEITRMERMLMGLPGESGQ